MAKKAKSPQKVDRSIMVTKPGADGPTSRLVPGPRQTNTVVEEFELLKGRRFNATKQHWRPLKEDDIEYVDEDTERLNMQVGLRKCQASIQLVNMKSHRGYQMLILTNTAMLDASLRAG